MTWAISIRAAIQPDAERLRELLASNQQSASDVLAPGSTYWVAEDAEGRMVGAVGLEYGKDTVLLRSAAVLADWRGQGVGAELVLQAISTARQSGCNRVYLFSTDASSYWIHFGFQEVPVSELVSALPDAPQVKEYEKLGWLPTEAAWRLDLHE